MLVNVLREYNINRIFLSCLGIWPFQSKIAKCLLPTIFIICQISYIPFEILTLYENKHDSQMIFESCYQMVITIAFLVKLLNQVWNRDKFQCLYENMENHWSIFTSDADIQTMKHYSVISQKFTIYYSVLTYSMMSMFITIPSFGPSLLDIVLPLNESRPRHLAVYADYGVDQDQYFVLIFCYTTVMIVIGISVMVAADTMHIACTAHACSLFKLIGRQVENITSCVDVAANEKEKSGCHMRARFDFFNEQEIYREYIVFLKRHQLAIKFVDVLNDTHYIVGLYFSFAIGAIFSLVGVRIVYVLDQLEEMIRFTFIILGALLQLMILCYSGQKLMDESQNIFHRVYATEWYRFSSRLKSLTMITLCRSYIPCKLMAGNLFPLSMTIFAAVIRMGMSYFTTFLSLKD